MVRPSTMHRRYRERGIDAAEASRLPAADSLRRKCFLPSAYHGKNSRRRARPAPAMPAADDRSRPLPFCVSTTLRRSHVSRRTTVSLFGDFERADNVHLVVTSKYRIVLFTNSLYSIALLFVIRPCLNVDLTRTVRM